MSTRISRRTFLKTTGLTAAATGAAGLGFPGKKK